MVIVFNEGMPRHNVKKTKERLHNKQVMSGQRFSLIINNYSGGKRVSLISKLV